MPSSLFRQRLGALYHDWPRFLRALTSRTGWTAMRNRAERLDRDPASGGVRCEWRFTSDLHIATLFPRTAAWLLQRALAAWPVATAEQPAMGGTPEVAFLIGHRGNERIALLLATLATIAAQRNATIECVVIEQSETPILPGVLPPWVRYLHTPTPPGVPYNRAATFNAGAGVTRAPILVFHDNDMLVPMDYAAELRNRHAKGWEFIDLKRFIFYLPEDETKRVVSARGVPRTLQPDQITQNAHGGSIAADRAAFEAIGGFDEEFVGWGGEDNDFWDRATTRRTWAHAYLPFIHLWHGPQPEKESGAPAISRLRAIENIPPAERIERLRQKRSK
jgi:hypothetical protein